MAYKVMDFVSFYLAYKIEHSELCNTQLAECLLTLVVSVEFPHKF